MKKTYITPQATSVNLYAEEALLSTSDGTSYEVNPDDTTENRWSNGRYWGSTSDFWGGSED